MNLILVFAGSYILIIGVVALLLTYYFRVIRPKDENKLKEWMDKTANSGEK